MKINIINRPGRTILEPVHSWSNEISSIYKGDYQTFIIFFASNPLKKKK